MPLAKRAFNLDREHHVAREVEHEQVHPVPAGAGVMRQGYIAVLVEDQLDDGLGDMSGHAGQSSAPVRPGQRLE